MSLEGIKSFRDPNNLSRYLVLAFYSHSSPDKTGTAAQNSQGSLAQDFRIQSPKKPTPR
jgi:hypothetical protein